MHFAFIRGLQNTNPCMSPLIPASCLIALLACLSSPVFASKTETNLTPDTPLSFSVSQYQNALHGFWLGQSIANWTGLVTEMDKIGDLGELKTGPFYTSADWGMPDQPSIWGQGVPSSLSPTIDFVLVDNNQPWGADDDTDIEYIYQHLLDQHQVSILSPEQIRAGWLRHIYSSKEATPFGKDPNDDYENFLWVSNQKAHDLMLAGMLPPETGSPNNNEHCEMIDAQLTTEIFGLYAPGYPQLALQMAKLPIRTVACNEAANIAEFYVVMHSLAAHFVGKAVGSDEIMWMAQRARRFLKPNQYPANMFDFVLIQYQQGKTWEQARDAVYQRYQVEQKDGYDITSRGLYCNGCFAAGINYAASLISLFYGQGDYQQTVKIAVLAGWDADNPAATWGGMLGFIVGKTGLEAQFGREFSSTFNIHRTRRNFANNGIDNFADMAEVGVRITERTLKQYIGTRFTPEK